MFSAQLIETAKSGSVINAYINSLNANTFCFAMDISRTAVVDNLQNGIVSVADYYDSSEFSVRHLSLQNYFTLHFFIAAKKASTVLNIPNDLPAC